MKLVKYTFDPAEIHMTFNGGRKVELVRQLRSDFNLGLKQAKDIMDSLISGIVTDLQVVVEDDTEVCKKCMVETYLKEFGVVVTSDAEQHQKEITVFAFLKNTDQIEGRGANFVHSLFSTEAAAREFSDGFIGDIKELVVYATAEQRRKVLDDEKRAAILAKLTAEERRILGFE